MTADWIALGLAYCLVTGLILFAFASASKRGDDADDALAERLLAGDPTEFPSLQPRGE